MVEPRTKYASNATCPSISISNCPSAALSRTVRLSTSMFTGSTLPPLARPDADRLPCHGHIDKDELGRLPGRYRQSILPFDGGGVSRPDGQVVEGGFSF